MTFKEYELHLTQEEEGALVVTRDIIDKLAKLTNNYDFDETYNFKEMINHILIEATIDR